MSWYLPLGRLRLIEIGRAFEFSSAIANSIGFLIWGGRGIKEGAPRASWSARAPIILARSKRVNCGGPIVMFLISASFFEVFEDTDAFLAFELAFDKDLADKCYPGGFLLEKIKGK